MKLRVLSAGTVRMSGSPRHETLLTMNKSTLHFIRHYVEMVIAMFAGMLVLGLPLEVVLQSVGYGSDELRSDAPALALFGMGVIMTVPMVAWMRHRGHGWRPCHEMAASMLVPTAGVLGLLAAGLVDDFDALMAIEHVVMLPSMLLVMLLRYDEYACHHGHSRSSIVQASEA